MFTKKIFLFRSAKKSVLSIYFLCLDTKKVTKKNQGQPDRSARLSLPPAPFTSLINRFNILLLIFKTGL